MSLSKEQQHTNSAHKTKAQLQKDLVETQNALEKKTDELNECFNELQKAQIKIAELDKFSEKITIAEQSEILESEELKAPKATFRIDLYKRDEGYKGRIDHPLTKDKKVFNGLDQNAIIEFIMSHLPQEEEEQIEVYKLSTPLLEHKKALVELSVLIDNENEDHVEASEPSTQLFEAEKIPVDVSVQSTNRSEEEVEASEPSIQLSTFKTIQADLHVKNRVILHDQPFQIQLKIDLSDITIESDKPHTYNISIFVRPFGTSARHVIAETQEIIKSSGVFNIDILAKALSEGTYRLEGVITSSLPSGKPAPYNTFLKSGIIYVQ